MNIYQATSLKRWQEKWRGRCAVVAVGFCLVSPVPVSADAAGLFWQPEMSERLLRLPAHILQKSIESDYAASPLAATVRTVEGDIAAVQRQLNDLTIARDALKGSGRRRHDLDIIQQKRRYINLQQQRVDLLRGQLQTRLQLYQRILASRRTRVHTGNPIQHALREKQNQARVRLARTVKEANSLPPNYDVTVESAYAERFSKAANAVERLQNAIENHPLNRDVLGDPHEAQVQDLYRIVSKTEADLALLDQDDKVLGYMAKLVSLDALALSEKLKASNGPARPTNKGANVTAAVGLFANPSIAVEGLSYD